MELIELLINARNDCFRMTNQSYSHVKKQMLKANYNNSILAENYCGSQSALLIEYYLKGILLPVLDVTVPEDNESLKNLSQELTDEQRFRIITSDDSVYDELSSQYGGKYHLNKSAIKKLGEESIKKYSHDLFKLASKIISKAEEGRFNELAKDGLDYDKYIIERLSPYLSTLDKDEVKNAFPSGRYGYLDGYVADKMSLFKFLTIVRDVSNKISKGVLIHLYDPESGTSFPIDDYMFVPDNLGEIYVVNNNLETSRIYRYEDGKLFLEYGLEAENILDKRYPLQGNSSIVSYDEENDEVDFYYYLNEHLKVEKGQEIVFVNKDDKNSAVVLVTYRGEIEEFFNRDYFNADLYRREQEPIFEELDKIKIEVEKKFTKELVEHGISDESKPSQLSKLGKKYVRYLNSSKRVGELKDNKKSYEVQQDIRKRYKDYKPPKGLEAKRPNSNEFRKAYVDYVGATLSYRVEKGRQIVGNIFQNISRTAKAVHKEMKNLSDEDKKEIKDGLKEIFKDSFKRDAKSEDRNKDESER